MLARRNRLVTAEDYRGTVRRGRRIASESLVTYLVQRNEEGPTRFGFIVSKSVGNAVTRNLVRRRLKAASFEYLPHVVHPGADIVVRALPSTAVASWSVLRQELWTALDRQFSQPTGSRFERRDGTTEVRKK